jgi:predicted transcriptional regulator
LFALKILQSCECGQKEEIAALILEAVVNSDRAIQTIIKYKAYPSHAQLKQFLSSLLEKGLTYYQKEDRLYTITEKGIHFLQLYNELSQPLTGNMFDSATASEFQIKQHVQVGNDIGSRQPISYLAIYDYEQRARTIIDEDAKNV